MCLRLDSVSNMRNYKRAKPRFEGTVLRTVVSCLARSLNQGSARARDGNTMWG